VNNGLKGDMLIHINDRGNLDDIVCITKDGIRQTRLEYLRQHEKMIVRSDIVLINCTNSGNEYTLHVTMNGYSGNTWILDILSEDQFNKVCGIASKMRMNALTYPECEKYIY
jgi:hypothetical protein